jgi:hypothetical protein
VYVCEVQTPDSPLTQGLEEGEFYAVVQQAVHCHSMYDCWCNMCCMQHCTYLLVRQAPCDWVHSQHWGAPVALPVQLPVQAARLCQLHDQAHEGRLPEGVKAGDDVGVMNLAQDLQCSRRQGSTATFRAGCTKCHTDVCRDVVGHAFTTSGTLPLLHRLEACGTGRRTLCRWSRSLELHPVTCTCTSPVAPSLPSPVTSCCMSLHPAQAHVRT